MGTKKTDISKIKGEVTPNEVNQINTPDDVFKVEKPKGQRDAILTIVTGKMGVGKTYLTKRILDDYAKKFKNKSILIFDPNDEKEYQSVPCIDFYILDVLQAIEDFKTKKHLGERKPSVSEINILRHCIRDKGMARIIPYTDYGSRMSPYQMKITMITLLGTFGNGVLLLDDVSKYIKNFEATDVEACFKDIRHKKQDVIMHMQSLNPLRPIHYEAVSVIRMHFDGFSVDKIRSKVGNLYEILKICQLIVDDEYLQQDNKYFHLYCYIKDFKIRGITFEQFEKACKSYLLTNKHEDQFKLICHKLASEQKKKPSSFQIQEQAQHLWIKQKMYYIN